MASEGPRSTSQGLASSLGKAQSRQREESPTSGSWVAISVPRSLLEGQFGFPGMCSQKCLLGTVGTVQHPQNPDAIEERELSELVEGSFLVVSQQ